jgi:hypothetical protein
MKYLFLLFLASCATSKPNCEVRETGQILGANFTILTCNKIPICKSDDTDCAIKTECTKDVQTNGKYTCIQRN